MYYPQQTTQQTTLHCLTHCQHEHLSVQVLIEDFAACGGHKFLFDYLLYLERKGSDDAREAVRNMVFLISGLVTAGFHPSKDIGGGFYSTFPLQTMHVLIACFSVCMCVCVHACILSSLSPSLLPSPLPTLLFSLHS